MFSFNALMKQSRSAYFKQLVSLNKNNSKTLFETINKIVSPQGSQIHIHSLSDCNNLLHYFKVHDLRANIHPCDGIQPKITSLPSHNWSSFSLTTLEDIQTLIKKIKPSSSFLDVVPTYFKKCLIKLVLPWST